MAREEKPTCFVISQFGEPYDAYFSTLLKPAIEESGMYAVRGDSLFRPTTIMDDIWEGIRCAEVLVAELTERNPNVFYELGLAHALSKPVVLITSTIEDVPFDLRSIRVLVYNKDNPEWGSDLRRDLVRAFAEIRESPNLAIPSTFKAPVAVDVPQESEVLMRLQQVENQVQRLSSQEPDYIGEPLVSHSKALKFNLQDAVFHTKFGFGKVIGLDRSKGDLRVKVNFDKYGAKWLSATIAPMEKVQLE